MSRLNRSRLPSRNTHAKPRRSITFRWPISTDDNGNQLILELACEHAGRRYGAYLVNVLRTPRGSAITRHVHEFVTEEVRRYVKTRFERFARHALAQLRSATDRPEVAAYLRGEHHPWH